MVDFILDIIINDLRSIFTNRTIVKKITPLINFYNENEGDIKNILEWIPFSKNNDIERYVKIYEKLFMKKTIIIRMPIFSRQIVIFQKITKVLIYPIIIIKLKQKKLISLKV